MSQYIHQLKNWPQFHWDHGQLEQLLAGVRHRQGRFLGRMEHLGFQLRKEAQLETVALEILKSSEIEGELLQPEQVRSSVARRLGLDIGGLIPADRRVEGIVEMMMDATQRFNLLLTKERLFDWHAALFPTGRSGMSKIVVAGWRDDHTGPMQVVSGPMGRERVHFEAPSAGRLEAEMAALLEWFNTESEIDPVLQAAIAHLWFVTIHPFDDGNGRIARAIADMQLARSDESPQRFYSMSAQIQRERNAYYQILEHTQGGDLDITAWLQWFLQCLDRALQATDETIGAVLKKAAFWDAHKEQDFNDRQKLMLNKLLDEFEGKLTTSKWAKIARCSQDTALRDIQDLMNRKVLEKEESGGRSTSYALFGH